MGESIKTPLCTGGPLPAIEIAAAVAGSPLTVSGTTVATTANPTSAAIYFISTVHCHVSTDGTAATVSDALVPAYTPMIFTADQGNVVNIIKATGASDGVGYVHNVATR